MKISNVLMMVCVTTGCTKAAARMPTTAAFAPAIAPLSRAIRLRLIQNGSAPTTSKNAGKNIAKVAIIAPGTPAMTIPIYAANVNKGPGTACVIP